MITNAEDNVHTTRELNKYKIDKTNMEIKATANKNIIIYLKRIADLNMIMNSTEIFKTNKKINLEKEDNKIDIVIKSLSKAKADESQNVLEEASVTKVIDFKSASIVRAKCQDEFHVQSLIKNGLYIGYFHYKVEKYIKPIHVIQCLNCYQFDHKANECQNETSCKKCGENHVVDECTANSVKCSNCNGAHKATYKQCSIFLIKANEKIQRKNAKKTTANVVRVHSAESKSSESNTNLEILKTIKELKTSQESFEININEKIEQFLARESITQEKLDQVESSLINQIAQSKVDCISETNNQITETMKSVNNIDSKLKVTSNNVITLKNDMVNLFVDCHNAVNTTQITVEHIKMIINAKAKRDKTIKSNDLNNTKTKQNGGQG